jgi:hypothetical protein
VALGIKAAALMPIISIANSGLNAAVLIFLNKMLSTQSADKFFLIFGLILSAVALFNQNIAYNFANFASEYCPTRLHIRAFVIELLLGSMVYGVFVWGLLCLSDFVSGGFNTFQAVVVLAYILCVLFLTVLYTAYSFLTERYLGVQLALFYVICVHSSLLYGAFVLLTAPIPDHFLFFITYSMGALFACVFFCFRVFQGKPIARVLLSRLARFLLRGVLVGASLLIFSVSPVIDAFFINDLQEGVYAAHAMSLRIAIAVTSVFVSAFGLYYSNSLVLRAEFVIDTRATLHFGFFVIGFASVLGYLGLSNIAFFENVLVFLKLDKLALFYNLLSVFPMLSLSFLARDEIMAKRWSRMGFSFLTFFLVYPSLILLFESLGWSFSISLAHSVSWMVALLAFYFLSNLGGGRE